MTRKPKSKKINTPRTTTKTLGDSLERLVTSYYEALGYKVTRDCNVDGHQVDLIATKYISGASLFTIMIEAKSRTNAVGINDFTKFSNTATKLLMGGHVQAAVLVTDRQFTQAALGSARTKPGIRLSTLRQLEQDLFNHSESLLKICHEYENSALFHDYIPLHFGTLAFHYGSEDVAKYISAWTLGSEKLLILSGDFGSGKTTILERVLYNQSKASLNDPNALLPLFFRLRSLLQYPDLWSFLQASLRDNNHISPTKNIFEQQVRAGRFLLLLDGFDEIETGASAQDRAQHLRRLAPLLTSNSRCVLSTRPTYFESLDDMVNSLITGADPTPAFARFRHLSSKVAVLLDRLNMKPKGRFTKESLTNVLVLSPLADKQITEYLSKHEVAIKNATNSTISKLKSFLFRIYDLEDLMTRPLLLNMVVETVRARLVDLSDDKVSMGPATLYEMYTHLCASRDVENRPVAQFLTKDERLRACRELAMAMLDRKVLILTRTDALAAISRARLPAVTRTHRSGRTNALERALTDIRVCSFLSFTDGGSLRFAHKSFFEFFVAQTLMLRALRKFAPFVDFSKKQIGREMVYFLGSFARDREKFETAVASGMRRSSPVDSRTRDFLRRIAFASGSLLDRLSLAGGVIEQVDLRRASASKAFIQSATLRKVTIKDLKATEWRCRKSIVEDTTVSFSDFLDSELEFTLVDTEFDSCTFLRCDISLSGSGWSIRKSKFSGGTLNLNGTGRLSDVEVKACNQVILGPELKVLTGTHATFKDCTVAALARTRSERRWSRGKLSEDNWYDSTSVALTFDGCALGGVTVGPTHLVALIDGRVGEAKSPLSFFNCSGVVLFSDADGIIREGHHEGLEKRFPEIFFCDADRLSNELRERKQLQGEQRARRHVGMHADARRRWPILSRVEQLLSALPFAGKVEGVLE